LFRELNEFRRVDWLNKEQLKTKKWLIVMMTKVHHRFLINLPAIQLTTLEISPRANLGLE
jgi:hypothetical protein